MQNVTGQQEKDAQPINGAIHKTCFRSFRKVFRWDRHFLDSETQMSRLHKQFLIEDELIGIQ